MPPRSSKKDALTAAVRPRLASAPRTMPHGSCSKRLTRSRLPVVSSIRPRRKSTTGSESIPRWAGRGGGEVGTEFACQLPAADNDLTNEMSSLLQARSKISSCGRELAHLSACVLKCTWGGTSCSPPCTAAPQLQNQARELAKTRKRRKRENVTRTTYQCVPGSTAPEKQDNFHPRLIFLRPACALSSLAQHLALST